MQEFKNDITYNQIATFKAIFEEGNISKAAKMLNISPASVSSSLKLLEKSVGEPLFSRTTRAIAPTEIGKRFYELVHSGVDDLRNAVELICDHSNNPSGSLSLNMARDIYDVFLKDVLMDFQQQFPAIQLEITLSDSFDSQVEHHFDIGFRFGETVNETMIAKRINSSEHHPKLALFASHVYVAHFGIPTSVEDLKKHSLIQFRAPSSQKILPVHLHSSKSKESEIVTLSQLNTAMIVNNSEVMVDSALKGLGIGYLMDATVREYFLSEQLVPLLKDHWCDVPNVYMYYAPDNRQTRRVACFLEFISEKLHS
ncbi:putative HTH-type transcriptional regulator YcaN [Thalassotalea loyana]|uniref:HTH-type transcriptional regulator YcaN n=1 Tax=Thalassotalea loyana TaxID=280483 RepID=A0ABQ6HI27_9GAMM|nr:LysR family transcriptional regulator [Thalassotalea loyana]GLX87322.1 putative HTH-type transcriptional regulator YcaN [Thalassotalea loyana]